MAIEAARRSGWLAATARRPIPCDEPSRHLAAAEPGAVPTLRDAIDAFLSRRAVSPATRPSYAHTVERLASMLGVDRAVDLRSRVAPPILAPPNRAQQERGALTLVCG